MRFSAMIALLCVSVSCSTLYTREKLTDKTALADHIDDNIKFSGDATLYKKNKLKTLGVVGMNCNHIIQNNLRSQSTKYGLGVVKTTTRSLTAEVNDNNLYTVCNMMEEVFVKNLESMGYTVKRTAEMKQYPAYKQVGSPAQGVMSSGITKTIVASDGNNYLNALPSFQTDDDWANALAKEAGVDALVWAMSSASWGLEGQAERDGLKGVTFRVDPKTMFYLVVPYDRCKAAGGCGGWVAHNGAIATTQEFDYTTQLFLPAEDSEKAQQLTVAAWTKLADEQAFLLDMHMKKFEQEMND